MRRLEKVAAAVALGLIGSSGAADSGLVSLPGGWSSGLFSAAMVMLFASLLLSRTKRSNEAEEITPAQSLSRLILVMGATALGLMLPSAYATGHYAWPAIIATVTIALAIVGHRFGTKHAHEIGEARFDTTNRD